MRPASERTARSLWTLASLCAASAPSAACGPKDAPILSVAAPKPTRQDSAREAPRQQILPARSGDADLDRTGPPEDASGGSEPEANETWAPPDLAQLDETATPRREGNHIVPNEPVEDFPFKRQDLYGGAWRPIERNGPLYWDGAPVPRFVPLRLEHSGMLDYIEHEEDGTVLAKYEGVCSYPDSCPAIVLFDGTGKRLWAIFPEDFMSLKSSVQVRGVAYDDGIVFFNDSCRAYPKDQNGDCSSVYAVRGATGELLWRSPKVVSNNQIHMTPDGLLTVFGFTSNPDRIFLLDVATGKVRHQVTVNGSPEHLCPDPTGGFELETGHHVYSVNVEGGRISARKLRDVQ